MLDSLSLLARLSIEGSHRSSNAVRVAPIALAAFLFLDNIPERGSVTIPITSRDLGGSTDGGEVLT